MLTITELEANQYQITCNIHLFSKISSKSDLKRNSFCKHCRREDRAKKLENKFKIKASQIHNNKYNYDNSIYIKNTIPISIKCILHDVEFKQTPADHLSGKTGCKQCIIAKQPQSFKPKSQELFIQQAKEIHKDLFDYSDVKYKTTHTHVTIRCIKHDNIFTQAPAHHLNGKNGCELCKSKNLTWSKENFVSTYHHKQCTFYIIQCISSTESFYKIGITSRTIKDRYNKYNLLPYQYKIILDYKDTAENVWDLEYNFKIILKQFYYKPLKEFPGCLTETFQLENQQLKDILFEINSNIVI